MFNFISTFSSEGKLWDLARHSFASSTSLLMGLMLLTGCPQAPPQSPTPPKAADNELHFDKRYLDSLDGPRSARTQRQMAIYGQLRRLEMAKRTTKSTIAGQKAPNDSVFDSTNGGPLLKFPNKEAHLADIYRKIDSLKVLEHIPLTPH